MRRRLLLERVPADCWDWIRPDDVVRHALAAFYAACRARESFEGPSWFYDGSGWSSRADFQDHLSALFAQRVNLQAREQGVLGSSGVVYPELPALSDMGHGCPAPSPAVGPAPMKENGDGVASTVSASDITTSEQPLFLAPSVQELPRLTSNSEGH